MSALVQLDIEYRLVSRLCQPRVFSAVDRKQESKRKHPTTTQHRNGCERLIIKEDSEQ